MSGLIFFSLLSHNYGPNNKKKGILMENENFVTCSLNKLQKEKIETLVLFVKNCPLYHKIIFPFTLELDFLDNLTATDE